MTLPNFFLIGTCKAGTTSMYHYLSQHPQVFLSTVKEPNYFAADLLDPNSGGPGDIKSRQRWVTELTAYNMLFDDAGNKPIVGEGTCKYLYSENAANRISRLVPDAKLVVILRNPVHRAYSAYLHMARDGRETLDFEQALDAEPDRMATGWNSIWHYRHCGYYLKQLERYLSFFSHHQMKIYLYEDWLGDNLAVLRDMFQFLQIDESFKPDTRVRYQTGGVAKHRMLYSIARNIHAAIPKRKWQAVDNLGARLGAQLLHKSTTIPNPIYECLIEQYRDDVTALQTLIGRDLSTWFTVTPYEQTA